MWGDHDRIASLDRHHRVVDWRRRWIRRRGESSHQPDRFGNPRYSRGLVRIDHSHRPRSKKVAKGPEGLSLVLDDLVLYVSEPGLFDRNRSQFEGTFGPVDGPGNCPHGCVHRLLARLRHLVLRCPATLGTTLNVVHRISLPAPTPVTFQANAVTFERTSQSHAMA